MELRLRVEFSCSSSKIVLWTAFYENLDQFARKYADDNKVQLPFAIDPQGKLKEKIQADYELGLRIAINETPTIYVVGNTGTSQPLVQQVKDTNNLAQTIEDLQKQA